MPCDNTIQTSTCAAHHRMLQRIKRPLRAQGGSFDLSLRAFAEHVCLQLQNFLRHNLACKPASLNNFGYKKPSGAYPQTGRTCAGLVLRVGLEPSCRAFLRVTY